MGKSLYDASYTEHLSKLKDLAPEQLKGFQNFNQSVFQDGALSLKEKEIIAVAITHESQCSYCINSHAKKAKEAGAELEELVEAAFVTAAIEAGGVVTHSTHVHNVNNDKAPDSLYNRSNLDNLSDLGKNDKEGFKGYQGFNKAAMSEGKLSAKFKEIIAVSVAHAIMCPYCIEVHIQNAKKAGVSDEEIGEAIVVAAELKAGGAYAHISNLIESYEEG